MRKTVVVRLTSFTFSPHLKTFGFMLHHDLYVTCIFTNYHLLFRVYSRFILVSFDPENELVLDSCCASSSFMIWHNLLSIKYAEQMLQFQVELTRFGYY